MKKEENETKQKLYVGIDVHKTKSVIYVENEKGEKVISKSIFTRFEEFEKFFQPLKEKHSIEVAIETGNLAFWLCDILHRWGIQTYVVNTLLNKAIAESSKKTDKRDARTLCMQLRKDMLPEKVYEPSLEQRDLRAMVHLRHRLVRDRVRIINRTHALLLSSGIFISKKDLNGYERYWEIILKEKLIGHSSLQLILAFKMYREQFFLLNRQTSTVEENIREIMVKTYSQEYALLQSIPGVGEITAWAVLAFAGDVKRFKNVRKFVSYMGLVPKIRESGGKKSSSGRITKMGISILRGYLTQGATSITSHRSIVDNIGLLEFFENIRKRKGWQKARIALARKIASIVFGVLKNRSLYDANHPIKKAA